MTGFHLEGRPWVRLQIQPSRGFRALRDPSDWTTGLRDLRASGRRQAEPSLWSWEWHRQ